MASPGLCPLLETSEFKFYLLGKVKSMNLFSIFQNFIDLCCQYFSPPLPSLLVYTIYTKCFTPFLFIFILLSNFSGVGDTEINIRSICPFYFGHSPQESYLSIVFYLESWQKTFYIAYLSFSKNLIFALLILFPSFLLFSLPFPCFITNNFLLKIFK